MKFLKNKWFWIILAVVAVVAFFMIKNKQNGQAPEYVTAQVLRGNLVQTVSATGKVESASETNLNFKAAGSLAKILVKVGDQVKSGQLLAQLSALAPQSAVAQANAQLAQAQADLLSIQAGSSNEEISVTQAQVNQAEQDLASAIESLSNTKDSNDRNLVSLKEQAFNKAGESLFLAKSALTDIDYVINNNNDYRDDLEYLVFSLAEADRVYLAAVILRDQFMGMMPRYGSESEVDELIGLMDIADSVLKATDVALDSFFGLLTDVSAGTNLTQTKIDTFKTTIATDQSNVAAKIVAVQTAKSNLQTKIVDYDSAQKTAENNVKKYQAALDVAKAQLALKQSGPRDFELKLYQAKVDQAQANLNKVLADLSDYSLRAPVDGIITKVNFKAGELVNVTSPVVSLLSESNLEIKVDVPESDIVKIHTGDPASITLDAFGQDRIFLGHLTFIDPAETIINDVVYYKVTVTFDHQESDVKSGMTANVIVTTANRENVLYVPQRSVVDKNGQRTVRILENNQATEKDVTTGLRADEGNMEILSGLIEGETVITFIKEAK